MERILKRGKFDEAEHFAKLFNLNIEIVYKAQTQKVMSDLQPWTESVLSLKESGEKLKNLLHNIQVRIIILLFISYLIASQIGKEF